MVNVRNLLAVSAVFGAAAAHPTDSVDEVRRELAAHQSARPFARRALNTCANAPITTALKERSVARRAAAAQALRQKRGLAGQKLRTKRDQEELEEWMEVSHDTSSLGYDLDTDAETIFSGNSTCALVPEVTIGPYWVEGELIRTDVTDGQEGVPLHLDLQFVDINTCEPIPEILIDIWACNSTGVYSGVSATGQGGLNTTHGRGIQETDEDGVVQFDTLFPGHYTGRTPHIHLMSTSDATLLDNGTYVDGTVSHIGQLFFDQDLITEVETTSPYSTNTQSLTLNVDDGIDAETATEDYDPFMAYVRLGDAITDGLLGYLTVFVDTTANYTDAAQAAAHYYEGGGVSNNNGGGSFPGGPGGPPSRK